MKVVQFILLWYIELNYNCSCYWNAYKNKEMWYNVYDI